MIGLPLLIPEFFELLENAKAAATGGVGDEDEFDSPVGEMGDPVGDKCL